LAEGAGNFEGAVRKPRSVTHRALHRRPGAYMFDKNLWFLPIGIHLLATSAWLLCEANATL
jgi:hypothetical protein